MSREMIAFKLLMQVSYLIDLYYFEQGEKSVLFLPASLSFRVKRGTDFFHFIFHLYRSAAAQVFIAGFN
jgi:hypothetical protein